MSCYLLFLRHCVWPLFYRCFAYLFLCLVISCCSGIVFDPCFTGVLCISSYVLLSLVAPALCLTPALRVFCVSLLMSCYLLLLRHCVWPLFYGCFVYLFLCLVISCCSGIVFDPCFTGILRISFYVLLSLVAPALCLTPALGVFCVSLLMSCYLLLLRHCVWPLFYGCFVYLFLCLVISCCSGIVFDPCFTGVLCISSYVLLSLVAPALCLTPVLRVFCVSLLMSCYLLLLRHCVWPLFYGCFVYLFLCLVISCCSGIVFDPCFTGVLCISSYVLLSLVAPALCLTPVLRVFCVSLLMSCYLLLLRHCVWPLFYGCFVYLFLCLVISCCSGIVFDPCFTGVLCISSYVLLSLVAPALCLTPVLRVFCVSLLMSCYLLLLRHCVWPLFYGCFVYLFLCLVISCCSGIVFDPCFTGVLCISSYVLLSLVAPALCLTPVLRVFCVSLLMSCYLLLLRHCVWPLFYGCFVYLFLCLVISCCSGIVFDPCFTGVLCISSYVLLSLVAPALCLTPVLRVFCVSLLMSCYLLLLRHCVWPLFYGCFVYLFLCLVISCCSGIVFDPCFTGVLCISSYVLLSLVAPALCLTPVLRVFCVSLLMSCYLLLLRHCVWPLFYGCFVYLFLCLVISCCSGIVFDPCFTGVLCISSYVLLSLVAPALCLTPVLRVFCVSLLMSCYLLLLRHCVWPLFYGCFVYLFLCLVISCCSGIVFDPCFTGVLCISSYVLLSLVAPALCLTPVLRVFCVSLLMSCYLLLLRHCVWPLFYGCFVYLFLCLVISCCSGIVFDPCFTGVLCISSYVLLSLVAPALCLTPVLRVFCVSLLMSCYLLLLRHCVWPLFYGCFVYLFLCLVISCCSGIVFDPCFTGVLCISSYVLLSLVAPALCLTPVLRVFCVSLLMSCYLLLLRHCVWPLFYGCFVYLFLCLVISCCSGIVFDPCFTGVLCISSYVLLSLVAPALCLTPVLRVFCVSLLMSCYLLLLRHCVWPLFYGCFVYLFLCLVISCCSGIVFDPCFTGVLCISSYVLLSLVAPALCLTPVLRVFCVSLLMSCYLLLLRHCVWPLFYGCFVYLFLCLVISCCSGIVFDPCFTGVLCISSYVLLSLVAPALCLTPVLRVFCVSLLMSCYLLLLRHCVWPLFYGCFVYLFLCLVISCCSGIVFDPCFTGVLRISSYVLLSLVAPALCLTPVLRVFCVSLLMSCYLLLLRHCVWPLFYGCFVYLFLCLVISCCSGIVFDPCFTGVLCISSYVLLSLVAPALCLTPVLRVFCVSLLMSCYLLLLRHCVWPLFYGCFAYLFLCLVISCCSGIVFDPCFTGVLCISSYVLLSLVAPALCLTPVLRVFCVSLLMSCYLLLLRHCVWPLFYGCFVYLFLCLVISCCSGIVFDPCFTGVLCISSYVLLSLVAPALCLTPVLRVFCVSLLMSCYLLLLRHCVWPLFYGCFVYLFLCLVISCCSGIVFDPCFTGVLCISSYVLLSLVAPALCLTPVLRVFCVSLLMSCYLLLLRHCVWPLFYGCFVYLFLCLVISCCSGIVFDPCFTGVLCISSYVLLSLVAPALCLTPVLRVFCVSLLMSCYLLLLRHCVWPLFYGCFVYLFLCLVISCCSGIVFDPCFTGVLCISSYVLLSLVAPALCLTPVLRVFCVSLLMSCYLLLLRHCVWPLFYGCFVYLFLCLVISCCSGIVFDPCFTGVLCISSYVLLSLVAPALCLTPVLRVFCVSLLMSCYLLLLRHCVWPLFYGCFVYLFLCLVISCCSGIVFDPCFTGVLCISSYVLLSLVAPALCLTPVLRVFCVSLLMSCYLLLLRHCVWPLFYGCFVYLFLCLVISCCSGIVFDPCFTGVLCISSYVLLSLVAPALCLTPVLRVFCVSLLMSCYLLLLRHCVWPLFYGCFVYLFLCLAISCCSGIVFDPCFTGVLCISSYVLLSLVAPALCLTPVLRVFCVSLLMSCYLLLLRHCVWPLFYGCFAYLFLCLVISCCSGIVFDPCFTGVLCVWPLFYGCFVYLFLCLVISCCSGIVFDPCFTGVLCISSYVLLSLVAPALCLTPVLRVFCVY